MAAAARIDHAALRPLLGEAEKGLVMLGRAARAEALDASLLELVDLRASSLNGCAYCVQTRTNKARKAGVEWARITQLATWPESPLFSDREGTALALTEALTRIDPAHGVPDALHDRAAQEFGPAGARRADRENPGHQRLEPPDDRLPHHAARFRGVARP
jgi:AhpD family alkylhydroperoxidase